MRKKVVLKILLVIVAVVFGIQICLFTQNSEQKEDYSVCPIEYTSEEKRVHVETSEKNYENAMMQGLSEEDRNYKIAQAVFSKFTGEELVDLTKYGLYELKLEESEVILSVEKLEIINPILYYDAKNSQWIVVCAGRWKDIQRAVKSGNREIEEYFGVELMADNNDYSSCVLDSYAFISDNKMEKIISTDYRTYGDVSNGFAFEVRGYVSRDVGSCWFGMCVYDANFSLFDCRVKTFYKHTY